MSCCGRVLLGRYPCTYSYKAKLSRLEDANQLGNLNTTRHLKKSDKLKLVILGQSGVGKSSIVLRYVKDIFNEHSDMTIGAAYFYKTVNVDGNQMKLDIWDTAGQDRFRCIANMYYRGAAGAIVVYDLTDKSSFEQAQSWIQEILRNATNEMQIVLVGNKLDLADNYGRRSVSKEDGQAYADKNGYLFVETSAKTAENIDEVFKQLVRNAVHSMVPQSQNGNIRLS